MSQSIQLRSSMIYISPGFMSPHQADPPTIVATTARSGLQNVALIVDTGASPLTSNQICRHQDGHGLPGRQPSGAHFELRSG